MALFLLLMLYVNAQTDLGKTLVEVQERTEVAENEQEMSRLSGTEDALKAQAYQVENLRIARAIHSQSGHMSVLLRNFVSEMNFTIVHEVKRPVARLKLQNKMKLFSNANQSNQRVVESH